MRHLLTSFLTLHWAAAFAALAAISVGGAGGGTRVFTVLGIAGTPYLLASGPGTAGLMALSFAVVSVLFLWGLAATVLGGSAEDADVVRIAYAAAACVLSMLLVAGALNHAAGLFPAVATLLAALLASHLATQAERWWELALEEPAEDEVRAAARLMAVGAAHSSMLSRIAGRPDQPSGGA